ncbi:MAG: hypothetical protein DRP63_03050 [Planctomycetota bacterium]|nr:MAG: hypothetical protein DRP63_03050 [Planctomycetota bacterium]
MVASRRIPEDRFEEWAKAARAGDEAAFRKIVESLQGRLFAVAFSVLRDTEEARGAVQDAFLRFWHALPSLRNPKSLIPFLTQTVRRLSIDRLRRAKRRRVTISYSQFADIADVEQLFEMLQVRVAQQRKEELVKDLVDAVLEAVNKMPDYYREAFLLRYMEGMSVKEIARFLGLPQTTVEGRIFKARQFLRDRIRRD